MWGRGSALTALRTTAASILLLNVERQNEYFTGNYSSFQETAFMCLLLKHGTMIDAEKEGGI